MEAVTAVPEWRRDISDDVTVPRIFRRCGSYFRSVFLFEQCHEISEFYLLRRERQLRY